MLNLNLVRKKIKLIPILFIACFSLNTQAKADHFRLSNFYAGDSQIRLDGEQSHKDLSITLSSLAQVNSATIHIEATSSISLIKQHSILNIRFNNVTIGQVYLNPNKPNLSANIIIPNELWHKQYNTITFSANLHSGSCLSNNAPDLWSEINLYKSSITLNTTKKIKNLNLQKLSGLLSPGIGGQRSVNIFTFKNEDQNKLIKAKALPAIAQALALRSQYQPINFQYKEIAAQDGKSKSFKSPELKVTYKESSWYLDKKHSNSLHVIVGTQQNIANSISKKTFNNIKGPFIKIEKTPEIKLGKKLLVPSKIRLIISGKTQEDVVNAAKSLAYMDDSLNPDAAINILSQTLSTATHHADVHLHPGNTYSLSQIGIEPVTFIGSGLFTKNIQLPLPADFYVPESAKVKISLDFNYGAGFEKGSTLNILINGRVVHGLPLQEYNGGFYNNYMLSVPARLFKAGMNILEIKVNQIAQTGIGKCPSSSNDLRFQLDNNSKITFPKAAQLSRQPDLKLMAQTGYPFTKFDANESTGIYITQNSMMSAALTMAGKLAQSSHNLIPNLEINDGIPEHLTTNAIVIARPKDLTKDLFSNMSASILKSKKWPYRLQNDLYNHMTNNDDLPFKYNKTSAFTVTEGSLGQFSVLLASENPSTNEKGTLVVIAADSSEILTTRIKELIQSSLWSQLSGDLFAWQDAKSPLIVMQVSNQYEIGEASPLLEVSAWGSNHPWYLLLIAFLITSLFCILTYILLKRRHKKIKEEW